MEQISPERAALAERLVTDYGDLLYRVCLLQLQRPADAEDAVQTVFLRLLQKAPSFASPAHEKAWLLRVAVNVCRDEQRKRARRNETDIDALELPAPEPPDSGILQALARVPEAYRIVLTLHEIEGLSVTEIAPMIRRTPSAVKMRLVKGRKLLEEIYRKEFSE